LFYESFALLTDELSDLGLYFRGLHSNIRVDLFALLDGVLFEPTSDGFGS
jgi:hypothetical protein